MATRREARERALGLCYELETRGLSPDELLDGLAASPDAYAETLLRGVGEHQAEIDELLDTLSEHWALGRMPAIDRALLRIGSYELGWEPEIPTAVAIDEAVDLANEYSTKDSGRFVNALLARIAAEFRPSPATPS
jgi:transcription antitermination protein NusB